MGAQRGMGLALHLGDTCFLSESFPLAQETGISLPSCFLSFGQAGRGALGLH